MPPPPPLPAARLPLWAGAPTLAGRALRALGALARWLPLLALPWLTACQPAGQMQKFSGPTMGSSYHISYVRGPGAPDVGQAQAAVQAILAGIDQAVSTYRPDSALARFNAAAAGTCMDMPAEAIALARYAQQLAQESDGAFDVTLLPALEAWGFGHGPSPRPAPASAPTPQALQALRARTGMAHLRVQGSQLCKSAPIHVEFNSIAAGYAVDRVAQWLQEQGVGSYLVEITGEMKAAGRKPDGTPWRIAIEAPLDNQRQAQHIVSLDALALSTSGDYRNWHEIGGQRQGHVLNPRTLSPVRHALASVTVAAPSALQADGLSTLLMVLGPDEGYAYASARQLAALFITRSGQGFASRATPAFEAAFHTAANAANAAVAPAAAASAAASS